MRIARECDAIAPDVCLPAVGALRLRLAPGEVVAVVPRVVGADIAGGPQQAEAHVHPFVGVQREDSNKETVGEDGDHRVGRAAVEGVVLVPFDEAIARLGYSRYRYGDTVSNLGERLNCSSRRPRRNNQNTCITHRGVVADDKDIMRVGCKECDKEAVAIDGGRRVGRATIDGVVLVPFHEVVARLGRGRKVYGGAMVGGADAAARVNCWVAVAVDADGGDLAGAVLAAETCPYIGNGGFGEYGGVVDNFAYHAIIGLGEGECDAGDGVAFGSVHFQYTTS